LFLCQYTESLCLLSLLLLALFLFLLLSVPSAHAPTRERYPRCEFDVRSSFVERQQFLRHLFMQRREDGHEIRTTKTLVAVRQNRQTAFDVRMRILGRGGRNILAD
jgi:hypothetical protein